MQTLTKFLNESLEPLDFFILPFFDITQNSYFPKSNLEELDNSYLVTLELPGYSKNDLNIEIKNNKLLVSGKAQEEELVNKNFFLKEIKKLSFKRQFNFEDKSVDFETVTAEFNNGLLNIELKKKNISQLRKLIDIK